MGKVKLIKIENVLGIEDLEIQPGEAVTVVSGRNGTGKSSVLEAIKALRGGHDATLIRQGAEEGRVVLVLDDDMEITKRIRQNGSSLEARHPTMGRISAPQTWLNGLLDQVTVNPVELMTAAPADRVRKLLEAMPLAVSVDELRAALGDGVDFPAPSAGAHALEVLDAAQKAVYDERTGVNRVLRENRTTAEQLRASIPADDEAVAPDVDALEEERRMRQRALDQRLAAIDQETAKGVSDLRADAQADIDRLREQIREVEVGLEKAIQEVTAEAHAKKEDLQILELPAVNRLGEEISAARERAKAQERYENTRRMLQDAQAKAAAAEERSKALTEAIARLERLKGRLLAELPIAGVTITDGEVHKDGIPFPRINTAERVKIVVQAAKLRAAGLPLVCVDGLECLDSETFQLFTEELEHSGLQAIITRVSDEPFAVCAGEVAHV